MGEDGDVLQDLVAQGPHVQVVADVLHQLEDQLTLVQTLQLRAGLPADL